MDLGFTFVAAQNLTEAGAEDEACPHALDELRRLPQWVCWRYETRPGASKPTKPPINPRTGFKASNADPSHWATHEVAVAAAARLNMAGVGFVLTSGDEYFGIDLDDVRDPETGEFVQWVNELLRLEETYAEVSPSGRGVRLIARGALDKAVASHRIGVEIYDRGRYLTITGAHIDGAPLSIHPAPRTLALLLERVERDRAERAAPPTEDTATPFAPGAGAPRAEPLPVGAGGGDFFRNVNSAALAALSVWVPDIFGAAARPQAGTGAYRVRSRDLGRQLQEDLSLAPNGIVDFGVHDMGDARGGKRTPIDIVMEYAGKATALEAAYWLCERLGRDPAALGWGEGQAEAQALGADIAARLIRTAEGDLIDAETGASYAGANETGSSSLGSGAGQRPCIEARPFVWRDPASIPRREWIYAGHYIRRFVTATFSPGGLGKSSLVTVEALAMATGRPLLGEAPEEVCRVWIWNGEDPLEEIERRVAAACIHYGIGPADIEGSLFLNSGRDTELIIAREERSGLVIARPVVDAVIDTILRNKIDVVLIDPFVSSHSVNENDNGQVDKVVKTWARIAEATNCSVELVHHARKTGGGEVTVEHARGAVSLIGGVRSARMLNGMSEDEQEKCAPLVKNRRSYFRVDNGKSNMAPPPEKSTWHQIVAVSLGNSSGGLLDNSDRVAVVAPWEWPEDPDIFEGVTGDLVDLCLSRIGTELKWREDIRSPDWVGYVVMETLKLDGALASNRKRARELLRAWIRSGALKVVEGNDLKGNKRLWVIGVE